MKNFWQQLTSQERRVAAVVGLIVFILLNLLFVKPHFHDVANAQERMAKAQATLALYRKELARKSGYQASINRLLGDANADVEFEDQSQKFVNSYNERANNAGVVIISGGGRPHFSTNDFFIEQDIAIRAQSTESQLVTFLYSLGEGNSLMRVKTMGLQPDASHQQLVATLSLTASYQKKPAAKSTIPGKTATVVPAENAAPKPIVPAPKAPPVTNKPAALPAKLPAITNKSSTLGAKPANTNKPAASFKKP